MTEQEYNATEGIRRSALWKLKKSAAHFKYELDNPPEPTPALVMGTAVHMAILQPEKFFENFTVRNLDLRTKEGKAEKLALTEAGLTILNPEQGDMIADVVKAVRGHFAANRLLNGAKETAYFWTDDATGERCKCRVDSELDLAGVHYIVDLKTCADASTDAFMRDAIKYGYHLQAAMYREGVKAVTGKESAFVFVAVEKAPPYAINILHANQAFITYGMDEFRYLMGYYHECKKRNEWPAFCGFKNTEINMLGLPNYLKNMVE